jgi:hypothetical protein
LFVENYSHLQAVNKTTWPRWILKLNTIPNPRERDGGGFAKTSRNVDESRIAGRARIALWQTGLVVIGRMARSRTEKMLKCHLASNLKINLIFIYISL